MSRLAGGDDQQVATRLLDRIQNVPGNPPRDRHPLLTAGVDALSQEPPDEQSRQVSLMLMKSGMNGRPAAGAAFIHVDEHDLGVSPGSEADRSRLKLVCV